MPETKAVFLKTLLGVPTSLSFLATWKEESSSRTTPVRATRKPGVEEERDWKASRPGGREGREGGREGGVCVREGGGKLEDDPGEDDTEAGGGRGEGLDGEQAWREGGEGGVCVCEEESRSRMARRTEGRKEEGEGGKEGGRGRRTSIGRTDTGSP